MAFDGPVAPGRRATPSYYVVLLGRGGPFWRVASVVQACAKMSVKHMCVIDICF